jgi:Tfp pilus assembly protein PilF
MNQARTWIPRGLALVAFAVYAVAAPASWYWLDAAELSAAGVGLGSPHPTGFPLYCLVVRAAAFVPVGELAFRVNLVSAASAALAVLWASRTALEASGDDPAGITGAVAAGAVVGASLVAFRHATVAEVYAPTAAALAATLLLFGRVGRGADARAGLLLALSAGLGLALHSEYRLLMAVPIAALMLMRLRRGARWPLLAPLVAVAMGAAAHAYVPVRSASGHIGPLDWGHPRTFTAFAEHALTAGRIRRAFADEMFARPLDHLATLAAQVEDHVGLIGLLAALAGMVWLGFRRRERWLGFALGTVLAGDALYSVLVNPMGLRDLQNGVPLVLAGGIAAGVGIAALARTTRAAAPFVGAAAVVLAAVPLALVGADDRWAAGRGGGDAPRRWAESVLAAVPPGGVALVERDDTAAGLLFATVAEAARPDVAVLVRQHLWDVRRNRDVLVRAGAAEVDPRQVLPSLLAAGRPVAWEIGRQAPPAGIGLQAAGPVARWHRAGRAGGRSFSDELERAVVQVDNVFVGPDRDDPNARKAWARAMVSLGRLAYRRADLDRAEALFRRALAVRPGHVAALVNLGAVLGRSGQPAEAAALCEQALRIEPYHVVARINAARYRLRSGDDAQAQRHIDRALAVDPRRADAWTLAGILAARAGNLEKARTRLRIALILDSEHAEARATLDKLSPRRRR